VELVGERLVDQRLLGGEAAVEGGRADLRAAGDLAHRHVEAAFREERPGGLEHAVPVVLGVRAQHVRQVVGHGLSL
jgi:hypothetical protein